MQATNGSTYTNSNGASPTSMIQQNGNISDYDRLKQDLLVEIKKEMQVMKNDIINGKELNLTDGLQMKLETFCHLHFSRLFIFKLHYAF